MQIVLEVIGFLHSNSPEGNFTKANKNSIKFENGVCKYIGKKLFIRPIFQQKKHNFNKKIKFKKIKNQDIEGKCLNIKENEILCLGTITID